MADPLSIAGLAIAAGEVVSRVYSYASAVRSSSEDMRRLATELFALRGALEHFDHSARRLGGGESATEEQEQEQQQLRDVVQLTRDTLDAMDKKLGGVGGGGGPKSKLGRAVQQLAWPFNRAEVERLVGSLERAKTWFIMVQVRDGSDSAAAVRADLARLADVVEEDVLARQTRRAAKDAEELAAWLAPSRPEEEQAKVVRTVVSSAGQWFFDDAFEAWAGEAGAKHPVTWITGKSGSGKTTLFSRIVRKLQARCADAPTSMACGFHYCSLDDASSQQHANVFGSVLAQLAKARPEVVDFIRPMRKTSGTLIPTNSLTIKQIEDVFAYAAILFDVVYVLIDALNETAHRRQVLATALGLCRLSPRFRVVVTSTLDPAQPDWRICVRRMRPDAVDRDIDAYVRYRLAAEPVFKRLSPGIRASILAAIVSGAHGVFRWASLSMDHFATLRTGRAVREALDALPRTLHESYVRLLQTRIPAHGPDRQIARNALLWLCFAVRPLSLRALADAVVLEEGWSDLTDDDRLAEPADLLVLLQGLVTYGEAEDEVTLAHDSIRSFLTSDWILSGSGGSGLGSASGSVSDLRNEAPPQVLARSSSSRLADSQQLSAAPPPPSVAFFALDPSRSHAELLRLCLTHLRFDFLASGPAPVAAAVAASLGGRRKKSSDWFALQLPEESDGAGGGKNGGGGGKATRDATQAVLRRFRALLKEAQAEEGRSDFESADGARAVHPYKRYPLLEYAVYSWPVHSESVRDLQTEVGGAEGKSCAETILDFFATRDDPFEEEGAATGGDDDDDDEKTLVPAASRESAEAEKTPPLPCGGAFASWVQLLLGTSPLQVALTTQPIYYAASYNMLPVLRLLLRDGRALASSAALDAPGGRYGSPPLFVALFRGNREACRLLLEAGADPHARDHFGTSISCRAFAETRGEADIVALMDRCRPMKDEVKRLLAAWDRRAEEKKRRLKALMIEVDGEEVRLAKEREGKGVNAEGDQEVGEGDGGGGLGKDGDFPLRSAEAAKRGEGSEPHSPWEQVSWWVPPRDKVTEMAELEWIKRGQAEEAQMRKNLETDHETAGT